MNRLAPLFATGLIASLPLAHAAPLTTAEQSVLTGIDGRYEQTEAVAHQIWDWAELGYKETQSSDLLASELEAAGFSIEKSVAGIPTAFIASFKQGDGPVIAILGEFDALPGFSQAAA